MSRGGSGSHWEGCEEAHHDCALARLREERALRAEEYERWHTAAARTLAAATSQAEEGFHEWACFLAEQAAQLAVKGLLHATGAPAWGHDLVALADQLEAPVGPPPEHKMSREEVVGEFEAAGYHLSTEKGFLPHQYFLVFAN